MCCKSSYRNLSEDTNKRSPGSQHLFRRKYNTDVLDIAWFVSDQLRESGADMPPGTDCPYPIRILAFFEMIRPYHVVIRILGKLLKNN